MIINLDNILKEKKFSETDLIYKILKNLDQQNLILIRKLKNNYSIGIKCAKDPMKNKFYHESVKKFFENLPSEYSYIFPSFDYVRLSFKKGLKEPPRCPICGKIVNLMGRKSNSNNEFNKTCGAPNCINQYFKINSQLKFGTDYPCQNKKVKEKIKRTNIKKYGCEYTLSSSSVREKIKKTNLNKYGFEYASSSPNIKNKVRQTNIKSGFWEENSGKIKKAYKYNRSEYRKKAAEKKRNLNLKNNLLIFEKYSILKGYENSDEIYKEIIYLLNNELISLFIKDNCCFIRRKNNISAEQINSIIEQSDFKFSFGELLGCFKEGIKEVPRCKVCGDKVSYSFAESRFLNTCNKKECVKKHIEITNLEKYGFNIPSKNSKIIEKIKNTNLERYGYICPMQNDEIKRISKENSYKKYGVSNISKLEEIKKKKENTFLKKFGFKTSLQSPEIKERIKNTCKAKYGVENIFELKYFQRKIKKKYKVDNINFDSSWEVAFYIYHRDHNINIECNPAPLKYVARGKFHNYYPDFKVDNKLIEIKGDMMIDNNGNIIPHPSAISNAIKKGTLNDLKELFEAKNNCIKENNIIILKQKDIKPYIIYVKDNYGEDFFKKCKCE